MGNYNYSTLVLQKCFPYNNGVAVSLYFESGFTQQQPNCICHVTFNSEPSIDVANRFLNTDGVPPTQSKQFEFFSLLHTFQTNIYIRELDLSHNGLGDSAAQLLGRALGQYAQEVISGRFGL